MTHAKTVQPPRRVSADAIAAMLAADGWRPQPGAEGRKRRGRPRRQAAAGTEGAGRATMERETVEALPPGHPVTWNALWGADLAPAFPPLVPMGGRSVAEIH